MDVVTSKDGVTIRRGPEWDDNLSDLAPELWPELIGQYRTYCARALPRDCRNLLRMVSEAERVGWAGHDNRDTYLRDGLGLDPQAVNWALAGLEIIGVDIPVPFAVAQKTGVRAQWLAQTEGLLPLAKHGEIGRGRDRGDNSTSKERGSTSAAYLVARLKRDHPDIAARLANGEFKSARAAARAAGIKVDTPPLTIMLRAWRRATPEERYTFLAEIRKA